MSRPPYVDALAVRDPVPLRLPRRVIAQIDAQRAQAIANGEPAPTLALWIERAVTEALGRSERT